ncbi:MAG: sodium dependent phosphate transporter [Actinobacteria bacterium]|nr:sodium dependent phosphate transporter [Actinomycetota bacterium]NIT97022.1 sodium dependent phosphate transporter [Actinomycetota bacterium]NIU20692.1 sodium dependent phosphate transporter [Actinomycetota bacterium]NIU68538.1 sodium dependent phosphate transporter [Actinomycetota bacterium]NIV57202.1 sodium dependent phosphate transporter [Actinomycetota bacterium]
MTRLGVVLALLYLFLVGVGLLGDGIGALGEDLQQQLFASVDNPMAGLMVGLLATVLAQSSSVTTSTIVGLVGTGLLSVEAAVPMVMGANIGTTVTNTLASLGHVRRPSEFRPAFAAATVHDIFNVLAVAVLLPLELLTGLLSSMAEALTSLLVGTGGVEYDSPIKEAVDYPVDLVVDALTAVGLQGNALGLTMAAAGLAAIFVALASITSNMRVLIASRVEASLNAMLGRGGGAPAILLGIVITVAVQSSSITTSILIPLAAAGVVTLRNIYPVTLGANVGTTISALLASLATARPEALTVALVHTIFNVLGILLFYPVPGLRDVPVRLAERLADVATQRRSAVIGYVLALFVLTPALGVLILR